MRARTRYGRRSEDGRKLRGRMQTNGLPAPKEGEAKEDKKGLRHEWLDI